MPAQLRLGRTPAKCHYGADQTDGDSKDPTGHDITSELGGPTFGAALDLASSDILIYAMILVLLSHKIRDRVFI